MSLLRKTSAPNTKPGAQDEGAVVEQHLVEAAAVVDQGDAEQQLGSRASRPPKFGLAEQPIAEPKHGTREAAEHHLAQLPDAPHGWPGLKLIDRPFPWWQGAG